MTPPSIDSARELLVAAATQARASGDPVNELAAAAIDVVLGRLDHVEGLLEVHERHLMTWAEKPVDFKSMPVYRLQSGVPAPRPPQAGARQQVSDARLREISGGVDIEVSAWPDDAKVPSLADEMQAMATELLSARISLGYRVEPTLAVPAVPADPCALDPAPGTLVRVTDGDRAGFVGAVQPRDRDDAPAWTRVRSQTGLCETRLFESKYLEPVR